MMDMLNLSSHRSHSRRWILFPAGIFLLALVLLCLMRTDSLLAEDILVLILNDADLTDQELDKFDLLRMTYKLWMGLGVYDGADQPIARIHDLISFEKLEEISGHEMFISNAPADPRFKTLGNDFRHHNPEFLRWARENLIPARFDPYFVDVFSKSINMRPKTLFMVKLAMDSNPSPQYEDAPPYSSERELEHYKKKFIENSPFKDDRFVKSYEGRMAFSFWLRREADGTADLFFDILSDIFKLHDREFYDEVMKIAKDSDT